MALYLVDKPNRLPGYDWHNQIIKNVDDSCPFLTVLKNGPTPTEMKGTWVVDEGLTTKNPSGLEGEDKTTGFSFTVPQKMEGVCELFTSPGFMVTDLAQRFKTDWDKISPIARAISKDAKNFAKSIEKVMLSSQECQIGSSSTKYLMRGAFAWLNTAAAGVSGVQDIPAALRPGTDQIYGKTSGQTFAAYVESNLKDQLTAAYKKRGGRVDLFGYVGIDLKQKMSTWNEKIPTTANITEVKQVANPANKISLMVDTFEYDAGTLRTMVMDDMLCDMASETLAATANTDKAGLFIDLSMWEMAWQMPITKFDLPDLGGGERGYHKAIARLNCLNPSWQCAVIPSAS